MAPGVAAIVRLRGEIVIAAYVAIGAGGDLAGGCELVRVCERKSSGAVIEFAVGPDRNGVAGGASGGGIREIRGHVIRNIAPESLRLNPVRLMAGEAIRGGQGIVIVHVAAGARRGLVRADQGETGTAVVKRSAVPALWSMAVGAVGGGKRRARGSVDGSGGLLPLGKVAAGIAAVRRSRLQIVIVVDVAGSTGHVGVAVRQQEARSAVIEFAVGPSGNGVAAGASRGCRREAGGDVIRDIAADGLGLVPIRCVARHAIGRIQSVIIVHVAGGAGRWSG